MIEKLWEQKKRAEAQARALLTKEDYTKDDEIQADKWLAEAADCEKRIAALKKLEESEQEEARALIRKQEKEERKTDKVDTAKVMRDYILGNITDRRANELTYGESRAAATQTTTTTAGGYLIPEDYRMTIIQAMKEFGGVYANSKIISTPTGNKFYVPYADDTSNVAYLVAESTDPSDSANNAAFSWNQKSFDSFKYTSGLVLVPFELLQDEEASPTLVNYINENMSIRMSRGLNTLFTTGAGTTTIEGAVTGATNSSVTPAAAAITRDNILDLLHDVDPAYRRNGKFMFNDSTLQAIKKLTYGTADDRPLWQPSIIVGEPDTIEGKQYIINQDMADIGASAVSVLFGDFNYYWIREVAGWRMVRLNERYAEKDQVGFTMFARYDGKVIDPGQHPIKKLTHAAS